MGLTKNVQRKFSGKHLFAFVLLALAGCDSKYDFKDDVAGSCKTAALDDHSVICIDYYDGKNIDQWRSACNAAMKGKWLSQACDTSMALGGCQAGNKIIWMYPSAIHANEKDAKQSCLAKSRKFIPAPTS